MNAAHLHLLVNHLPVIGTLFAIALLLWALLRARPELARVALAFFVLAALSGLVAYWTGDPAEHLVEGLSGFSEPLIEAHEEAAELATFLLAAYGLFAVGSLAYLRRRSGPGRRFAAIALVLSLLPMGTMAYTAYLGGSIRHSEIHPGPGVAALKADAGVSASTDR